MIFEFDPAKSDANRDKHGIDFVSAPAIWTDPGTAAIDARSTTEPRTLVIGHIDGVLWAAVVTQRGERTHLISVRRARDNEREIYLGRRV